MDSNQLLGKNGTRPCGAISHIPRDASRVLWTSLRNRALLGSWAGKHSSEPFRLTPPAQRLGGVVSVTANAVLTTEENMPKLTDNQLIVLSKAAARDDGVAVAPHGMGKAAAAKVGSSLVARKLMRESRSKPGMPVWREAEGKNISLVITRAGRDAIRVGDDATPSDLSGLEATEAGAVAKTQKARGDVQPEERSIGAAPRTGSKQALIVDMLSKEQGVTIDALIKATGWLPHTTRAALTGLRKRGFAVERITHAPGASLYRITSRSCPARV